MSLYFPSNVSADLALSVIVITYNRAPLLARCLSALLCQDRAPDYEIIVVDDGSTDETANLPTLRAPRVRYCRQERRGRSMARNSGLELARGKISVYVDSDVLVIRSFLAAHATKHAEAPRRYHGRVFVQGSSVEVNTIIDPDHAPVPIMDLSRAFFDTKNVSIPTALLQEIGGFSPLFTEYGWEDLEAGLRLRDRQVSRLRAPGAIGFHCHPPFKAKDLAQRIRLEEERGRMGARFYQLRPTWEVRLMVGHTLLHAAAGWLITGGGRYSDGAWPPLIAWLAKHPRLAELLLPVLLAPRTLTELRRTLITGLADEIQSYKEIEREK